MDVLTLSEGVSQTSCCYVKTSRQPKTANYDAVMATYSTPSKNLHTDQLQHHALAWPGWRNTPPRGCRAIQTCPSLFLLWLLPYSIPLEAPTLPFTSLQETFLFSWSTVPIHGWAPSQVFWYWDTWNLTWRTPSHPAFPTRAVKL